MEQTKSKIEQFKEDLAKHEEGSDEYWWVMGVIQDLTALNRYRMEMDKMEKILADTVMEDAANGEERFGGIEDLELLAIEYENSK